MRLSCFHCGEPVLTGLTWTVSVKGEARPLCCIGCQSIAQAILQAGGEKYYEQRTGQGLDVRTLEALAPWTHLLDDPQWSSQHVRVADSASSETTLAIEGLRCGACAWLIEKLLGQTPGVETARANASTERLFVRWNPKTISLSAIAQRVAAVGYALLPISSAPIEQSRRAQERLATRRLFIAGLSAAQIMMYAYPEYLEGMALEDDIRSLMRTASMIITTPVMVYSATPFFQSAWRMLRQGRLGMDVPVSLGLWIAFIASLWAWWTNTGEVYFDSVSMFVFLLLGARWVEAKIRAKTSALREKLATAPPLLAHRVRPEPGDIAAWSLRPGDFVRVRSGDRIPADGVLQSHATDLDCSWITGESLPVTVHAGARVTEGSINLGPEIEVLIDSSVADSTMSRLSQLAEQAASDRPHWVNWADRVGGAFTAGILCISALVAAISIFHGQSIHQWLPAVIAVLVVTCPCALSMAGPTAYAAALSKLLEKGVALSSSQTLERLENTTDVIFDKTGTLTDTDQSKVTMVFGDAHHWRLAQALASTSTHPLAVAIARVPGVPRAQADTQADTQASSTDETPAAADDTAVITDAQQHSGLGVSGHWGGQTLKLGSTTFVDAEGRFSALTESASEATVFFAIDNEVVAGFAIDDVARPESKALIADLHQQGLRVWCLSGDRAERVERLANSLGIPDRHQRSKCTPEDKKNLVQSLQQEGAKVLMVGDGLNDAPVLAQADVSLAVQSAAPLARQKADAYLIRPGLDGVRQALATASQARRVLKQNLAWALGYNILAVPFAALGMISPLLASVGMALSSLIVVLNSARITRAEKSATL